MNKMRRSLVVLLSAALVALAALCVAGCGQQASSSASTASSQAADASEASTTLVVYYSATGNTEAVAKDIASYTGADVFAITPEQPYTQEDLNYRFVDSRISHEHDDPALRDVALVQSTPDGWDQYETIVLGYPIWFGEAAYPVASFVKANDFSNKTVMPFCTSASSELGDSAKNLAALSNGGSWTGGIRFPSGVNSDEVLQWVDDLGLEKQGLENMN